MRLKIVLIILLACSTALSFGQSRKKNKKKSRRTEQTSQQQQQPTALNPLPQKEYAPKSTRKATKGPTYESEQQFYERMEALEKTKRKNEALSQKPQYSDPMYFGHKRPPKKRKPGKMKYCKECGIRH